MKGVLIMNNYNNMFNQMFNTSYINQNNYYQLRDQIAQYQYQQEQYQNCEIANFLKATHDMCEAMKKLDPQHQQQAIYLFLAEIANEFWHNNMG